MRLTVPEPKITLYDDGFDKHDQLGRKETGDKLSNLVERIDDPLVIALDGAWGSGKSFFLKCWVGEHKNHNAQTKTVYFDAFKHDFLDDPLIALTGAIAERFEATGGEDETASADRSKKIKKAAWAVGRGVFRVGASALTFGATEALSDMGDAIAEAVGNEAKTLINSTVGEEEAEDFWNAHDARIAAMEAFRVALTELTEPNDKGDPTRKLIIVVDELDRCRPDYALSLLEIIKHFFNVPGVHFVLGVNLRELQNSVRARYGSGVDAAKYLQRFVGVTTGLQSSLSPYEENHPVLKYFRDTSRKMGVFSSDYFVHIQHYIKSLQWDRDFSIRSLHHLLTALALTPAPYGQDSSDLSKSIIAGLLVLNAFNPSAISKLKEGTVQYSEISRALNLASPLEVGVPKSTIAWKLCLAAHEDSDFFREYFANDWQSVSASYDSETPRHLLSKYVEVFQHEAL